MRSRFSYIRPSTLDEALTVLAERRDGARVLAGGTDLMISVRKGELTSDVVIDVSALPELSGISMENGRLRIGAAVTFSEIVNSESVRTHAPILAEACSFVGSVQIRNAGTLGGNVANASPAADGIPPLIVHNAVASLRSADGERMVSIPDLITGPYRTGVGSDELIECFLLEPTDENIRYSFQRIARRKSLAIARINTAALGWLNEDGTIGELRLSAGSVTPTPCRMEQAEQIAAGRTPDAGTYEDIAREVSGRMIELSGIRASTEYKKPAVEGLVMKTLTELFGTVR